MSLDDDGLHQFVVFLRRHGLGEFISLCQHVAALAHTFGELELCPFLTSTFTLQDVDVEVGKLGIVEVEVGRAVGVLVQQVGACPVEHGHEVIADAVDALGSKVAQTLFINLNLMVAVRTAILNGLHYGQTLHHAPAHAITFDVFAEVVNLLSCPHLAKRHVVQGGHNALHADLFQLGKRDLVFLAKPSPSSFHSFLCYFYCVLVKYDAKVGKKQHCWLFFCIIFVLECIIFCIFAADLWCGL